MKLSILFFLILCALYGTWTFVLGRECGNGHSSDFPGVCICDKNYAGPNPKTNCFVVDWNGQISYLITSGGACSTNCSWEKGGDPYAGSNCVDKLLPVCGK